MVTTNNSSFAADVDAASVDEKVVAVESTHCVTDEPSRMSNSAKMMPSTSSPCTPPDETSKASEKTDQTEKTVHLGTGNGSDAFPRTSDLSTPASAHQNPFDTDIEAMITHTASGNINSGRRSMGCRGLVDSEVWPGQSHWKKKAKEQKMKRSCTCLSRLSKRNRLIVKVLIGVLIVGIAVGVGLGISKPLGAPIWGEKNT